MRKLLLLLVMSAFATSVGATVYNFNVAYSGGGVAALSAGDDPLATNLSAGDIFNYRLSADADEYWRVEVDSSIFPFFAFITGDGGTRTANFTLTLSLDGVQQFTFGDAGATNSFAHIGTNTVALTAGLEFDEILLNYELLDSTNADNRPSSLLPWGGAPEQYSPQQVSYIESDLVIPEPASLTLLGLGLVGAAFARRRKL